MRINRAGNESLNNYTVTSIVIFGVTTIVSWSSWKNSIIIGTQ
jgi:hypothetical protein